MATWTPLDWWVGPLVIVAAVVVARIIGRHFFKPREGELKWRDNWFRLGYFDNCQKNASDGSSNLVYNLFSRFFSLTSFIGAFLWGMVTLLILSLYVFRGSGGEISPRLIDVFISPLNIIFVIFIISAFCLNRPMQKAGTMQDHKVIRKKFSLLPFLSIILVWFILFSGFSLVFDKLSSHPNPTGGCDICGDYVQFEYFVNNVVIHRYCNIHAIDKAFLEPTSLIYPLIHKDPQLNYLIIFGALMNVYTWLFVIGFAFIRGKGYTWK